MRVVESQWLTDNQRRIKKTRKRVKLKIVIKINERGLVFTSLTKRKVWLKHKKYVGLKYEQRKYSNENNDKCFFDDVVFVLGIGIQINNNTIDYIMVITIT